jgi:hypothetical protein
MPFGFPAKTEVTNFNMRFCFHQPTLRVGTCTQVSWAWLQVLPAIGLCGGWVTWLKCKVALILSLNHLFSSSNGLFIALQPIWFVLDRVEWTWWAKQIWQLRGRFPVHVSTTIEEECKFHLVPHFEDSSLCVTVKLWVPSLGTSWNTSYFHCCWFELWTCHKG